LEVPENQRFSRIFEPAILKNKMAKVKVFSTPTCPYCHDAKDFLKELKVPFTDVDVSEDEKARDEMVEKSGQMGVPVIIIDDEVLVGFDKDKIEKLVKK